MITKRICIGLQHAAKDRVLHGSESGVIHRAPSGGYSEPHQQISQAEAYMITSHHEYLPITPGPQTDNNGVERTGNLKERTRAPFTRWYFGANVAKPTREELEEAARHHDGQSTDGHGHGSDGHEVEGDGDRPGPDRQLTAGH